MHNDKFLLVHTNLRLLFSHINLPPFPNELQIMADAGFANIQPVITPAAMNPLPAGPLSEAIRRFVLIVIF